MAVPLNTVVRAQCFADINGETLDSFDQSDGSTLLDDVLEHLSADAVNPTSAKQAGAAATAKRCVVGNARRLTHTPCLVAMAAGYLRTMPGFVASMTSPASSRARMLVDLVGSMVTVLEANAAAFVTARRSSDFLTQCTADSVAIAATIVNRDDRRAAQCATPARLTVERSRGPGAEMPSP